MSPKWMLIATVLLSSACAFPATAQRSRADGSFDRTLNVSGPVDLDVTTGSGTIEIEPHNGNQVEIHARITAGWDYFRSNGRADDEVRELEMHPPIVQTGSSIRVGHLPNGTSHVSISYQITVPASSSVHAHTGSGTERIAGIIGNVDVTTGSGKITLNNIHGALHAETGSGGISADGEQTANWNLQTGSGSIDIRLPQNAGFQLSAHTGSGGVTVDRPMTLSGRIDIRHDLSGKVGNGGYALDLHTGSGHIHVE